MTRRATAYHEAGHAVVGVVLRLGVRSASIIPDPAALGHTLHRRVRLVNGYQPSDDQLARSIVGLLAGPVAEAVAQSRHNRRGAAYDNEAAVDLAMRLVGSSRALSRYLRESKRRAAALVEQHWPAIAAVAEALLRSERLDRAAIRTAIKGEEGSKP